METLKIGLIGCGFMGTMHANCYLALKDVQITAVADIRRDKAEAVAVKSGAEIYSEGFELIENANVDIIDICLPTYLHTKYALAAMNKVKYLFIEKPVALTSDECELLTAKKQETGCKIQVGQVIRFWNEYTKLKEFCDSKVFGKVINASFKRISPRPDWGWNNWLLDVSRSGGAAQDLHIHDIDFVISVFDLPKGSHSIVNSSGDKNSYINTQLIYPDFVVDLESTWGLPITYSFSAGFRVVFEKAVVEYAGGKLRIFTENNVTDIETKLPKIQSENTGGNISDLGGYYNELLYFTEQARNGGKIVRATLEDAIKSLTFLLKELQKNDYQ